MTAKALYELQTRNIELEEEVAELKRENESLENIKNIYIGKSLKAKKLIKKLLDEFKHLDVLCNYQLRTESEEFLKED